MIWNGLSNLIADEFEKADPDNFLKEKHARQTYCGDGGRILTKVKDDPFYPKVKDRHLHGQKNYAGYSQATLRALLYIREMHEYFDPSEIDFMTDFGPGYGNFTRCWNDLFGESNPHYQLVDLPRLQQISKYHLDLHDIQVQHTTLEEMIGPNHVGSTGKSLFFASHSLNELDLKTRTKVEERLGDYDYIFIVYNQSFDGIDNTVWFDNLMKRIEHEYLTYTYLEQSTCKWRLVAVRKENVEKKKIIEQKDPIEVLTHKRFDVVMKYLYASNLSSDYYQDMYKKHMKAWNGFKQSSPPKKGFHEFDAAFRSIIDNEVYEPIPISPEGHIANGAHRLSAALYQKRPINTRWADEHEIYPVIADYEYWHSKKIPTHMMGRTAVEYARLKPNTHVICLFPIAHTRLEEVLRIITRRVNVFYATTEELNKGGQLALMKEIYYEEGWASEEGIRRKGNQCFRGEEKVTFLLVDGPDLQTVKEMKDEIRVLFDVGNHSVHISDFQHDAIRIAKTVFNDNSIHFLNHRKNVSFENHTKLMADMKPDDNTMITSSAVLSLYGLRDCKDIDLIYYNNPQPDSHNPYLEDHYKLTLDEIFNNPTYHFYYQGFKYVSLDAVKKMKMYRHEPKDIKDVELIEQIT